MSKRLQEIIDNAEIIQRSFTEPTSILVTDKKQILIQIKADFDSTNIPVGTLLESMPNNLLNDSIKTGRVNRLEFDADNMFGLPCIMESNNRKSRGCWFDHYDNINRKSRIIA